jgi:hypothetical protein
MKMDTISWVMICMSCCVIGIMIGWGLKELTISDEYKKGYQRGHESGYLKGRYMKERTLNQLWDDKNEIY